MMNQTISMHFWFPSSIVSIMYQRRNHHHHSGLISVMKQKEAQDTLPLSWLSKYLLGSVQNAVQSPLSLSQKFCRFSSSVFSRLFCTSERLLLTLIEYMSYSFFGCLRRRSPQDLPLSLKQIYHLVAHLRFWLFDASQSDPINQHLSSDV